MVGRWSATRPSEAIGPDSCHSQTSQDERRLELRSAGSCGFSRAGVPQVGDPQRALGLAQQGNYLHADVVEIRFEHGHRWNRRVQNVGVQLGG